MRVVEFLRRTVVFQAPEAPSYRQPKDVFIVPIFEAELKLIQIEERIFLLTLWYVSITSTLEQRPERFNRLGALRTSQGSVPARRFPGWGLTCNIIE
jgi:hypothetical protein